MAASSSSGSLETPPHPLPTKSLRHTKSHKVHRSVSSETAPSSSPDRHSTKRRSNNREWLRLLEFENREIKELQRMLVTVTEQLKSEKRRADECDRRALDAAHKYRTAENARILAEQNASRANEVRLVYHPFITRFN